METWEIELREKLMKEVPEGTYNLGTGNIVCYTGKLGRIEFEVALQKEARRRFPNDQNNQHK